MHWFNFVMIGLKLLVVFICIIMFLKTTGKTSMAQMTNIDFIGNMILGGIAGGIIYNSSITIFDFLIVLIIWTVIMFIFNYVTKKSEHAKAFIVGNPIILMDKGKLILDAFVAAKLDMLGFATLLRMKNIKTISDVNKALLEPNGQLTVVKKGEDDIATIIVENEQVKTDALEEIGKNEAWLKRHLKREGYGDTKKVDGKSENFYKGLYCVEYYKDRLFVIPTEVVKKPTTDKKS